MVPEIKWSENAYLTFREAVKYLEEHFGDVEILKFTGRIDEKLSLLTSFPQLGRKAGKRGNMFKTVINKRIVLYYQYKPRKNEIVLISFWNTLQHPKKLKI